MTMPRMPDLPQAEIERIRGYLLAQANKLSVSDLVGKVRQDVQPLRQVAASVPPDRFRERPGPDDWSAAKVFTHILTMNEHGADAIEGILDTGAVPPRIEDQLRHEEREGLTTSEDYWRTFASRRERLLERVSRAGGDEHLDVKITHPMFGPLSWREWLLFMRLHDLDHTRQIQAVSEQLET
jgi:hypothetical protein